MAEIVKLTGNPVSDELQAILERLENGEHVDISDIAQTDEVKMAYSNINFSMPTIHLSNREELRNHIFDVIYQKGSVEYDAAGKEIVDENGNIAYNGNVENNSRLDIVIGLPGSGKSSSVTNLISEEFSSRVIDNDEIKKLIPQYNDGWGTQVVHEESKLIADTLFRQSVFNHENIVLPKVGSDWESLLKDYIEPARQEGYTVNIHYVELDINKAVGRMLNRFITTGRFIPPEVFDKYQDQYGHNKIAATFEIAKASDVVDGYSRWDNNVLKGQRPILKEHYGLTGNYIKHALLERGEQNGKNDEGKNDGALTGGESNIRIGRGYTASGGKIAQSDGSAQRIADRGAEKNVSQGNDEVHGKVLLNDPSSGDTMYGVSFGEEGTPHVNRYDTRNGRKIESADDLIKSAAKDGTVILKFDPNRKPSVLDKIEKYNKNNGNDQQDISTPVRAGGER